MLYGFVPKHSEYVVSENEANNWHKHGQEETDDADDDFTGPG